MLISSLFVATLVLFLQYGLRYLLRYRLSETEISLCILGLLPVLRLPIAAIGDVREVSLSDAMTQAWAPRWSNRLFGRYVWIQPRAEGAGPLLLTPDDPDAFIHAVGRAIARRRQIRVA